MLRNSNSVFDDVTYFCLIKFHSKFSRWKYINEWIWHSSPQEDSISTNVFYEMYNAFKILKHDFSLFRTIQPTLLPFLLNCAFLFYSMIQVHITLKFILWKHYEYFRYIVVEMCFSDSKYVMANGFVEGKTCWVVVWVLNEPN